MNPSPLAGVDLHDILSAPPPAFWPPAPGWWLVALLLLGVLSISGWRLTVVWRRRRRLTRILSELDALATKRPEQVATQISVLLRRVALMCFSRSEVAPLTGNAWLAFLDRTGGNQAFSSGAGTVLATAPYASAHMQTEVDKVALIALARQWIKLNLERQR
jgi:hypothetical protein